MEGEWKARIPKYDRVHCIICREQVTNDQPFIASKQRRGGTTIYAHFECFQKEQEERKEGRE